MNRADDKPYSEIIIEGKSIRTFNKDVDDAELVWHRDREDRIVTPINENNWKLQMDNELPVIMEAGKQYIIPKNTFHRVIKGSGELVVEILKTNFNK